MPFPDIDPIAFSLGPLAIRWYALAYLAGIGFAFFYGRLLIKQKPLWHQSTPPMTATPTHRLCVLGDHWRYSGRAFGYVLFYSLLVGGDYYLNNPPVDSRGVGRRHVVSWRLGRRRACRRICRASPQTKRPIGPRSNGRNCPIGLLLGRVANFINGELYGRVTTMPWGVVFPDGGPLPRHPSQLYEGLLEGLLCFIILRIATHNLTALRKPGWWPACSPSSMPCRAFWWNLCANPMHTLVCFPMG